MGAADDCWCLAACGIDSDTGCGPGCGPCCGVGFGICCRGGAAGMLGIGMDCGLAGPVGGTGWVVGPGCSDIHRKPHLGQYLDLCGRTS